MNEQFKTLWKQAGGHYNSGNQNTWPQYTIDNPEKFAELIVGECADIADEPTSQPFDSYGKKIKQHFGVEE